MKCRQHSSDLSSAAGVCASCLRERLFLLISAQSQSQLHSEFNSIDDDRRKSDPQPPLIFPRSVSPYVTRRKFDEESSDRRFYSTPQIGPSIDSKEEKKKHSRFSFITSLFKSRSDKSVSDPFTASTSSPLWHPAGHKSKQVPKFVGERILNQNQNRVSDRGMSPERLSSCDDGEESSSRSSESCEPTWKQTPVSVTAPVKRRHSNMSGLAFCLSPLVRASPNRNWNRNSLPADIGAVRGEVVGGGGGGVASSRKAARLAAANSFGKNRSKKMADFGRGSNDHRR